MAVSYDEFLKLDMRVGRIIRVEDFPKARKPAYQLFIDFGAELGMKQSSAQVVDLYSKEELINRLIVAVVNFAPKRIADFSSQVLVLGTPAQTGAVVLLDPGSQAVVGARVF